MGEKIRGKVKFYDKTKLFGFIEPLDGSPDVFLHWTSLSQGINVVEKEEIVEFDTVSTPKGPKAVNLIVIND